MFFRTIFVCFVGFVLAKSAEQNPQEITFAIQPIKVGNYSKLTCDHADKDKQQNIYTVREGDEFTIITKYNSYINVFNCKEYNNNVVYHYTKKTGFFNATTVEKGMGTLWNCTILAHRNDEIMLPVVKYEDQNYSAAYCYMKIHVRQENSPQTILVNNMVLRAVRTDLSEKDVDFTAEYQYADGDIVDVTCVNFKDPAILTMEYNIAGTMSDNSIMKELSSHKAIGFRLKLHSGHNNSYMICTNTESTDYTKVLVRFLMRTKFNIVSIKINGMILRPKLMHVKNHHYDFEYKYSINQLIKVVCEVHQRDMNLVVSDKIGLDHVGNVTSYIKTDITPKKKSQMSFYLSDEDNKKLTCGSDNKNGGSEETVTIRFTGAIFPIDEYPLHMELPSNGTVMELYNDDQIHKLKVIFYEFEDGETLQFNCGPLLPSKRRVVYLQFNDSHKCKVNWTSKECSLTKSLKLTSKDEDTVIACYIKEELSQEDLDNGKKEKVLREIRVILHKRVLSTTTTSTTTPGSSIVAETSLHNESDGTPKPHATGNDDKHVQTLAVIVGAVLCIVIICISIVIVKLRKRNHPQGGFHDRNYQNLQTSCETSIPAYPPQWESNYAVPVDRRSENTTYSVPCQEPALYSTPIPKSLMNKKQKQVDPTYAVLEVPNARGRKNIFKETDDPNYSEVYANRQEQCYAKVLPKSVRNKMAQDNNPYSYVTNEPAYVNTDEPEPMYCEPTKAEGVTYANLNNARYVNSNTQEYVEPTYCEPQKLRK